MDRLGKLPTALIAVFAVLFAVIIADLVYFVWRRRRFQRRSIGDQPAEPSKELLYFFCWKNQSRVEPDRTGSGHDPTIDEDELDKWQRLYGPSRMLFTIKEEDREGSDHSSSIEKTRPVSVDDGPFDQDDVEVTPFSTPCASPPYYTPSPSPPRDAADQV